MGQVVVRRPGSDLRCMFVGEVIPNDKLPDLSNALVNTSYYTRIMMHMAVRIRKICVCLPTVNVKFLRSLRLEPRSLSIVLERHCEPTALGVDESCALQ
jgi:hypothetical protein